MAKYYCVLFDADNTLLDFDAAESKALAETLINYGIEPMHRRYRPTARSMLNSGSSWKKGRSVGKN